MSADLYLGNILTREQVDTGPISPVRGVLTHLQPILSEWAGGQLVSVSPSGSFTKGTANHSGTDIDLFISLSETTAQPLNEIYDRLYNRMVEKGFTPRRQNVSINLRVRNYDVALVPARRQGSTGEDHSLYRRKADTWTKTNVQTHIHHVLRAARASETRVLKLWRDQKRLEFPSFYLELTVIAALSGVSAGTLSEKVWRVFHYLRDNFENARIIDPANTNNVISEDLTMAESAKITLAACQALTATDWSRVIV